MKVHLKWCKNKFRDSLTHHENLGKKHKFGETCENIAFPYVLFNHGI